MSIIQDGTGTGNKAKVDGKRLFVHAISESEVTHATESGDSYNINTGVIGLTSSTASGVLYIKNNEDNDLVIEALAVGIGSAGTTTDVSTITIIKNPTTGTLISGATNVDMNQNRNFGSNKSLTGLAYKGAEGNTVTNGSNVAIFFQSAGGRLFASVDLTLQKGDSLAVTIDTNTTSGTTNVYAAAVCYLRSRSFAG